MEFICGWERDGAVLSPVMRDWCTPRLGGGRPALEGPRLWGRLGQEAGAGGRLACR